MRPLALTFARFVRTEENRSALHAVLEVVEHVSRRPYRLPNPLFLHGPAGVGKSHLVSALVAEVTRRLPGLIVKQVPARELGTDQLLPHHSEREEAAQPLPGRLESETPGGPIADLLVVEDLQHLPPGMTEAFAQLVDDLHARQCPMVFTALAGPRYLTNLPARVTSRLVAGLVVGMEGLSVPSRLALLSDKAQRRQLAVSPDVLRWLAEHLGGGGRQLEGAIVRLESLSRLGSQPPDVTAVAAHFREEVEAGRPSVERIVERVGGYYQVEPRQLRSRRRSRQVLLPRQVGMYLARQLTGLSLDQIGEYFGGRDHSTVLHACRKVERALDEDAVLSGAVRQLHSDLV
jgi:chromosomal replication initiator protein